jgi:fructokinase
VSLVAICFGEALIDVYPDHDEVAGAPLHVAVHLARAGFRSHLLSRLGRDAAGDRIVETLHRYGVSTDLLERDPHRETGRVTVDATDDRGDDGSRFIIHEDVAFDAIEGPDDLLPHDVFYFGTLAARAERSRVNLGRLLTRTTAPWRVLDVNLRPPHVHAGALALGMTRATLLKVSESESRGLPDLLQTRKDPRAWFLNWPELTWICITRGKEGAELLRRDGGHWSVDAPCVDDVHTTVGAGDAFLAGLVAALVQGVLPQDALESATRLAGTIVAQPGGLPL